MLRRRRRPGKEMVVLLMASGTLFLSVVWCALSGPDERPPESAFVRAGRPAKAKE